MEILFSGEPEGTVHEQGTLAVLQLESTERHTLTGCFKIDWRSQPPRSVGQTEHRLTQMAAHPFRTVAEVQREIIVCTFIVPRIEGE